MSPSPQIPYQKFPKLKLTQLKWATRKPLNFREISNRTKISRGRRRRREGARRCAPRLSRWRNPFLCTRIPRSTNQPTQDSLKQEPTTKAYRFLDPTSDPDLPGRRSTAAAPRSRSGGRATSSHSLSSWWERAGGSGGGDRGEVETSGELGRVTDASHCEKRRKKKAQKKWKKEKGFCGGACWMGGYLCRWDPEVLEFYVTGPRLTSQKVCVATESPIGLT